jgi:hypothetical protein
MGRSPSVKVDAWFTNLIEALSDGRLDKRLDG